MAAGKVRLEAARTALQYSAAVDSGEPVEQVPVRSPIDGKILKVVRECEGPVRTGDPLLEVGDPSALEVEVDVLSADAVKIKPGMKVLFDRWGGDKPLEGLVRVVEPVGFTKISALGVEEQRVLIICDFTSPAEKWQRLGDGYRVEARFILWHEDSVLQVPASSLFRYKEGWAVFVVENHHAERRVVKVGQRNGLVARYGPVPRQQLAVPANRAHGNDIPGPGTAKLLIPRPLRLRVQSEIPNHEPEKSPALLSRLEQTSAPFRPHNEERYSGEARAAADVDALVQLLGDAHGALRGKAELARGLLLQG